MLDPWELSKELGQEVKLLQIFAVERETHLAREVIVVICIAVFLVHRAEPVGHVGRDVRGEIVIVEAVFRPLRVHLHPYPLLFALNQRTARDVVATVAAHHAVHRVLVIIVTAFHFKCNLSVNTLATTAFLPHQSVSL